MTHAQAKASRHSHYTFFFHQHAQLTKPSLESSKESSVATFNKAATKKDDLDRSIIVELEGESPCAGFAVPETIHS